MNSDRYPLESIVATLSNHSQRATYGAVGRLVGLPARSVMSGRPKTMENSWVVSAKTKKPTGYLAHEIHPSLELRPSVVSSPEQLAEWLRAHR